jgi:hypothetical protein
VAVVKQPIQDGSSHDGIAEHAGPFADTAIAGEQQATALVAPGHELEKQMGSVGFKGTRLPTSFLFLYSTCYVIFSIALSLYFINQPITGSHRTDVEAIPGDPEQIKTLKISKPSRNTCTSVDS